MIWDIVEKKEADEDKEWGVAKKVLKGQYIFPKDTSFYIYNK